MHGEVGQMRGDETKQRVWRGQKECLYGAGESACMGENENVNTGARVVGKLQELTVGGREGEGMHV